VQFLAVTIEVRNVRDLKPEANRDRHKKQDKRNPAPNERTESEVKENSHGRDLRARVRVRRDNKSTAAPRTHALNAPATPPLRTEHPPSSSELPPLDDVDDEDEPPALADEVQTKQS
jgi:hypothetical protein